MSPLSLYGMPYIGIILKKKKKTSSLLTINNGEKVHLIASGSSQLFTMYMKIIFLELVRWIEQKTLNKL